MQRDYTPELDRVREVLSRAIALSGRTRQSVEEAIGAYSAGLSKILEGKVILRFEHVLAICEALGLEPASVVGIALPPKPPTPEERKLLLGLSGIFDAEARPRPVLDDDELDRRLRRALARLLVPKDDEP